MGTATYAHTPIIYGLQGTERIVAASTAIHVTFTGGDALVSS